MILTSLSDLVCSDRTALIVLLKYFIKELGHNSLWPFFGSSQLSYNPKEEGEPTPQGTFWLKEPGPCSALAFDQSVYPQPHLGLLLLEIQLYWFLLFIPSQKGQTTVFHFLYSLHFLQKSASSAWSWTVFFFFFFNFSNH